MIDKNKKYIIICMILVIIIFIIGVCMILFFAKNMNESESDSRIKKLFGSKHYDAFDASDVSYQTGDPDLYCGDTEVSESYFIHNNKAYCYCGCMIKEQYVDISECLLKLSADDTWQLENGEVYRITGVSEQYMLAVKYNGIYYEFMAGTSEEEPYESYEPQSFFSFLNDLGAKDGLLITHINVYLVKDHTVEKQYIFLDNLDTCVSRYILDEDYPYVGYSGDSRDMEPVHIVAFLENLNLTLVMRFNAKGNLVVGEMHNCNSYEFEYGEEKMTRLFEYIAYELDGYLVK